MSEKITRRYLSAMQQVKFGIKPDYKQLDAIKPLLDAISSIMPHEFYIMDYYKRTFFYFSSKKGSVLMAGHTKNDVLRLGYEIYSEIMSEEYIGKLEAINKMAFDYYYTMPVDLRHNFSIAHNLILQDKAGRQMAYYVQGKPFLFTPDDQVWMILFSFHPTVTTDMDTFIIKNCLTDERLLFCPQKQEITPMPTISLNEKERYIAYETMHGTLEKQLSEQLNISINGIHYYKKRLMKKTMTRNFGEAMQLLLQNNVM